jgi:hypothetical protein
LNVNNDQKGREIDGKNSKEKEIDGKNKPIDIKRPE